MQSRPYNPNSRLNDVSTLQSALALALCGTVIVIAAGYGLMELIKLTLHDVASNNAFGGPFVDLFGFPVAPIGPVGIVGITFLVASIGVKLQDEHYLRVEGFRTFGIIIVMVVAIAGIICLLVTLGLWATTYYELYTEGTCPPGLTKEFLGNCDYDG